MAPTPWTFKARNGNQLHAVLYSPKPPMRAVVIFTHGIGEHSGRYEKVLSKMADKGIEVRAYDVRSFGKSEMEPSERGKIPVFSDVVDDLEDFYKDAAGVHDPAVVPFFLMGSSLGGLITLHASLRNQQLFRGLILCSPAIDVPWTAVLKVQAFFGGILGKVTPNARIVPAVKLEMLSQDQAVLDDYMSDPLNMPGNVRAATGAQILAGMNSLKGRYAEVTVPVYGQHGSEDKCTSQDAHAAFMNQISSTDKTLNLVQGGYHELLQGPESEECTSTIIDWVLSHTENMTPQEKAKM